MIKFLKEKKIIVDMFINIFAVSLPVVVLQFIVYPYLSKFLTEDAYGLMLTFYSLWFVISNSLGNVLNNIRLLNAKEYEEQNLVGDFKYLLVRYLIVNLAIIAVLTVVYSEKISLVDILLSLLIATVLLIKAYIEVGFRIKLNYMGILTHNVLQCVGFLIGVVIVKYTGFWQLLFLMGFSLSCFYTIVKTGLLKEPLLKTHLYKNVRKQSDIYSLANFSCSSISYIDKIILYPLMGGECVSIYYTATIMGKVISMVSGPMTSVILSYISKWDKVRNRIITKILAIGVLISTVGYFVTIWISRPVIGFLFPQWVTTVMVYLPITTIAVLIQAFNSFLDPFVLKFYDIKWQIVINASSVIVYVVAALLLWNISGLMGFCVGTILGNFTKTVVMIMVHAFSKEGKCAE